MFELLAKIPIQGYIAISSVLFLFSYVTYKLYTFAYSPTAEEIEQLRQSKRNYDNLNEAKVVAENEQAPMREEARVSFDREVEIDGLKIICGRYQGKQPVNAGIEKDALLSKFAQDDRPCLDVTTPLRAFVKNSTLHLEKGTKAKLQGFKDPCPGKEKELLIVYRWRGNLGVKTIEDEEELLIGQEAANIGTEEADKLIYEERYTSN